VPFDFDLDDVRLHDGRLVMVGGAFEKQTVESRKQFLRYLITVAADDPDAAWTWLADATVPGPQGESEYRLRRRLRQAVPFRDGGWSGDERIAEQLMVQWRVTREAGWTCVRNRSPVSWNPRDIRATSGSHLIRTLLAALRGERSRLELAGARCVRSASVSLWSRQSAANLVHLPQMLDEVLTLASSGRLRVKLHRRTRKRTPCENRRCRSWRPRHPRGSRVPRAPPGAYLWG
jgi:hypothetical protein